MRVSKYSYKKKIIDFTDVVMRKYNSEVRRNLFRKYATINLILIHKEYKYVDKCSTLVSTT